MAVALDGAGYRVFARPRNPGISDAPFTARRRT
jgi:hypothetical protein